MLQQFYLNLRRTHKCVDSIPITTRQFEALIRLAEARARIELREFVTEQDAQVRRRAYFLGPSLQGVDNSFSFSRTLCLFCKSPYLRSIRTSSVISTSHAQRVYEVARYARG